MKLVVKSEMPSLIEEIKDTDDVIKSTIEKGKLESGRLVSDIHTNRLQEMIAKGEDPWSVTGCPLVKAQKDDDDDDRDMDDIGSIDASDKDDADDDDKGDEKTEKSFGEENLKNTHGEQFHSDADKQVIEYLTTVEKVDISNSPVHNPPVPKNYYEKSVDSALDDLIKGGKGEGTRGGKVIGHTRSGKPIYQNSHKTEGYTAEDHEDANHHHQSAGAKARMKAFDFGHYSAQTNDPDTKNFYQREAAREKAKAEMHHAAAQHHYMHGEHAKDNSAVPKKHLDEVKGHAEEQHHRFRSGLYKLSSLDVHPEEKKKLMTLKSETTRDIKPEDLIIKGLD